MILELKCFAVIFPSKIKIQYMFAKMMSIRGKADPEQVACVLEDSTELVKRSKISNR